MGIGECNQCNTRVQLCHAAQGAANAEARKVLDYHIKSGQVRVAWFAFITDKVVPGATSGPFVAKLVTEDLNASRDRTYTKFSYTTRQTRVDDMEKYVAGQATHILGGVDTDDWEPF